MKRGGISENPLSGTRAQFGVLSVTSTQVMILNRDLHGR
jgi:hypothetical protein